MSETFDVLAVNMGTHKVRLLAQDKSERNAEAVEMMAIARNGVDDEFFVTVPHGKYADGDEWNENEG